MAQYRVCRSFTVESGHMLSRHPEGCRFPHGHTRTIDVVLAGSKLNSNGMLVDFKALNMALSETMTRFDHSLAVNSVDPFLPQLQAHYPPEALIIFEDQEPTTEVIAKFLFEFVDEILRAGWASMSDGGIRYEIPAGSASLERVRVSETPNSWAEYGV